jgi:fructokinase
MTVRKRRIVGLGEVIHRDAPRLPTGLGAEVALAATRLGHAGVVIGRVGQDEAATDVQAQLVAAGVDVSHLQSDPDLATPRIRMRGGREIQDLEGRYAFDNLQYDFDLEDLAQVSEAVVYGLLARRSGQTRGEEHRFLEACATTALRVFDLTNRREDANRVRARAGLETADAAIVDDVGLDAIAPAASDQPRTDRLRRLVREFDLEFIVDADPASNALTVHTADDVSETVAITGRAALIPTVVAIIAMGLDGAAWTRAPRVARDAGEHMAAHPDEAVPEALRGGAQNM